MINTISTSKLTNAIYVQLMDYVVTAVADHNPTALNVKPQHDLLLQKVNELKDIYKSDQGSAVSELIVKADLTRDQSLTGIAKLVDAYTLHFDENMRTSADLLLKNIRVYGTKITKNDFQTETAKIESIVNDWRTKTELANAVDMLGILDWALQLETDNNEFKRLYALRTVEYSQRTGETMESKRVEVDAAFTDLCNFLNSYSIINTTNPDYAVVISEINAFLEQYSTLLKQRGTRKKEVKPQEN